MKKTLPAIILVIVSIIIILFLIGGKSGFKSFQESALKYAQTDNRIDQTEYEKLRTIISNSDERQFQTFKDDKGKIDNSKVKGYLLKYFKAKNIKLTEKNIWQPNSISLTGYAFNVNLYIENSASMDGYLNDPNTQFKNSVYSLLARLKLFVQQDSLNLYFVNEKTQAQFKDANNQDLVAFKNILNPTDFRNISSGLRGETDINELIKRCLNSVNKQNLSVFISDCIYSPGKKHKNARQYLADQKNGIFLNFATALGNLDQNLAAIVLQLKAGFKGFYYDKQNTYIKFNNLIERPYYIWFIGTNKQIKKLIQSGILKNIDGGYLNKVVFKTTKQKTPDFKILAGKVIGSFSREGLKEKIIKNAEPSERNQNKGMFGFNVAVDFSDILKDSQYFLNPANYKLSNANYQLTIEPIKDENNIALNGYTHLLKLQTKKIKSEDLKIELIGKLPAWVYSSSSDDDSSIESDTTEQAKTFGLKYMMEGVSDAFSYHQRSNSNVISSITIKIKK